MEQQRQSFITTQFETRESQESDELILSGYFIIFDSPTELWPGYLEQVSPRALANLNTRDVRALFNHDTSLVLGRTGNSTLTLTVDAKGLRGDIRINKDDPQAMGAYARVKRGDVVGCSFGFFLRDSEFKELAHGATLETLTDIELYEVSPCTFPAYPQTEIAARRQDWEQSKKRALELKKQKVKEKYSHE